MRKYKESLLLLKLHGIHRNENNVLNKYIVYEIIAVQLRNKIILRRADTLTNSKQWIIYNVSLTQKLRLTLAGMKRDQQLTLAITWNQLQ